MDDVLGHATPLFLTYLGLAVGKVPRLRVDRAGIALVGATALLVAGAVPFDEAVSARCVNYEALALLFGMMVVVAVLRCRASSPG
ncbi:MAG: hypothetical protein U0797_15765 [Gemmataceae bacterium]